MTCEVISGSAEDITLHIDGHYPAIRLFEYTYKSWSSVAHKTTDQQQGGISWATIASVCKESIATQNSASGQQYQPLEYSSCHVPARWGLQQTNYCSSFPLPPD